MSDHKWIEHAHIKKGALHKELGIKAGKKLRLLFVAHKHRLLTQAEIAYADAANVEFITAAVDLNTYYSVLESRTTVKIASGSIPDTCLQRLTLLHTAAAPTGTDCLVFERCIHTTGAYVSKWKQVYTANCYTAMIATIKASLNEQLYALYKPTV